ncbi:Uncharacterised protein [Vibrio cholerae]|nr:Uncharacterised protein [Vibrio cholerae]
MTNRSTGLQERFHVLGLKKRSSTRRRGSRLPNPEIITIARSISDDIDSTRVHLVFKVANCSH